jgi:hypothetical protein
VKRFVALIVAIVALAAAIDALGDLTQGRPEPPEPGTATVVVFDVATRRSKVGEDLAARTLWSVCQATTSHPTVAGPEPVPGGWQARIEPALGRQGRARLQGCLEDLTSQRVVGHVRSIETLAPAAAAVS